MWPRLHDNTNTWSHDNLLARKDTKRHMDTHYPFVSSLNADIMAIKEGDNSHYEQDYSSAL